MPHYRALPKPVLAGMQEKGAVALFQQEQDELSVFLMYQRMVTVWATKGGHFGETVLQGRECSFSNFAHDLSFDSVVAVKIRLRGIAESAGTVIKDVAFFTSGNRLAYLQKEYAGYAGGVQKL